jgi:K+-transporting ATPase KdpF subunit
MSADALGMVTLAVAVLIYLVYTMLRPERF